MSPLQCAPLASIQLILVASLLTFTLVLIRSHSTFDSNQDDDFHEAADHSTADTHHNDAHHHNQQHTDKAGNENTQPKDKVLLKDVKSLVFTRHKRTTSRRTHSIHQLSCVGGTAGCKLFTPNVVECLNDGFDKSTGKQSWKCHADMSDRVKFNHVEVICEGYDYPEDDYILLGSCGLEFTLDYVDPHDYHDQSYFKHMDDHEKDMHHERVRAGHKSEQESDGRLTQASFWQKLHAKVPGGSLTLIVLGTLAVILMMVRCVASSRDAANRSASFLGSSSAGLRGGGGGGGGGGGRGAGYGPLRSAVMSATKKAC